ncbi:hypothetical protein [Neptuniibacter sp.]|uniref:hypothetical protein n=1 Tax=Neptuniibacter sp. TaxID=1962643 RepID=UPI003B5B6619
MIDPTARISKTATIGPGVVVSADSCIEDKVYLGANSVIGPNCRIGAGSQICANVTLYSDIEMGENCLVHSGAVIGADGFGFANDQGQWQKIAQLGGVRIGKM